MGSRAALLPAGAGTAPAVVVVAPGATNVPEEAVATGAAAAAATASGRVALSMGASFGGSAPGTGAGWTADAATAPCCSAGAAGIVVVVEAVGMSR